MSAQWLLPIVEVAAKIGHPLALAGASFALFFGAILYLTKIVAPVVPPEGSAKLLLSVFRYGFILSLCSLLLGVFAWFFVYLLEPQIVKLDLEKNLADSKFEHIAYVAPRFVEKYPGDTKFRHILGTSYFALGRSSEGIRLYSDMLSFYQNYDDCDVHKTAATSSLAAFYLRANELTLALKYSNQSLNCDGATDAYMINHMQIIAMIGQSSELALPRNYSFQSSYYRSKFMLLKFSFNLDRRGYFDKNDIGELISAYCDDARVKKIIESRFMPGDFSGSSGSVEDYDYEIKILKKNINVSQRDELIRDLQYRGCSQ